MFSQLSSLKLLLEIEKGIYLRSGVHQHYIQAGEDELSYSWYFSKSLGKWRQIHLQMTNIKTSKQILLWLTHRSIKKEWRAANELIDDPRWNGYEVPPTSNANYGWILNIVSKLSQNGVAGFLLANGALSDDGTELKIRQQLIENNLVEAIIILPKLILYHRHQRYPLDSE